MCTILCQWVLWWFVLLAETFWLIWIHVDKADAKARRLDSPAWAGVLILASVLLWTALGQFHPAKVTDLAASSFAGFAVGSLLGFLFSSYDQEATSVGRVRDWLLGGLGSVGLVDAVREFRGARDLLKLFVPFESVNKATAGAMFVTFVALGFYCLYMLRKLEWNILFVSRDLRRDVELELRRVAAEPLWSTGTGAWELTADQQAAFERFIAAVEAAQKAGASLNPDDAAQLARAYFYTKQHGKAVPLLENEIAWRPSDDALGRMVESLVQLKDHGRAVRLLESFLIVRPESRRAHRLLGFALLWNAERLDDAVEHSQLVLQQDPGDPSARFNLACARAQQHERAAKQGGPAALEALDVAIEALREALKADPGYAQRAWSLADDDFESLAKEPRFLELVGKRPEDIPPPAP